mgnify:CR=1 FL=1
MKKQFVKWLNSGGFAWDEMEPCELYKGGMGLCINFVNDWESPTKTPNHFTFGKTKQDFDNFLKTSPYFYEDHGDEECCADLDRTGNTVDITTIVFDAFKKRRNADD